MPIILKDTTNNSTKNSNVTTPEELQKRRDAQLREVEAINRARQANVVNQYDQPIESKTVKKPDSVPASSVYDIPISELMNKKVDVSELGTKQQPQMVQFSEKEIKNPLTYTLAKGIQGGMQSGYGLTSATESLKDTVQDIASKITGYKPVEYKGQNIGLPASANDILKATEEYNASLAQAEDQYASPGQKLYGNIVAGTTQMIPTIALSAVNPAAGLASVGVTAGGAGARKAKLEGANPYQALGYGALTGGVEVGTEMLSGLNMPFMKGAIDDVIEGAIKNGIKSNPGKALVKYLTGMVGEGTEEVVSSLVNPWLQKMTYNKDAKVDYSGLLNDFLVGAGVSGVMGAPSTVIDIANSKQQSTSTTNNQQPIQQPTQQTTIQQPIPQKRIEQENQMLQQTKPEPVTLQSEKGIVGKIKPVDVESRINTAISNQKRVIDDLNYQSYTYGTDISKSLVEANKRLSYFTNLLQQEQQKKAQAKNNMENRMKESEEYNRFVSGELPTTIENPNVTMQNNAAQQKQPTEPINILKTTENLTQSKISIPALTEISTQSQESEIKPNQKILLRNLGEVEVISSDDNTITVKNTKGNNIKIGKEAFNNLKVTPTPVQLQKPIDSNIEQPTILSKPKENIFPMGKRNTVTVVDRKVNAYQYENPEVKPFFQEYAQYIKEYEFINNAQKYGANDVMDFLKSETGLQPKQIADGLDRIIKDQGAENVANAKRLELALDKMLVEGFYGVMGDIPPIQGYLEVKSKIEGKEIKPPVKEELPIADNNYYAQPVQQKPQQQPTTPQPITDTAKVETVEPKAELNEQPQVKKYKAQPPKVSERVTKDIESDKKVEPNFKTTEEADSYIAELESLKEFYDKEAIDNPSVETEKVRFKINIQLFAAEEARNKMISKFYNNVMKAESVPQYIKDMFKVDDFEYIGETNEQQINDAWNNIKADRTGIEKELLNNPSSRPGGVGTAESFIIWKSYMRDYDTAKKAYDSNKTDDNKKIMLQLENKVKAWLNIVRQRGTTAGRTIQTYSQFDATTPEGALLKAEREIDKANNKLKNTDPKKLKDAEDEAKGTKKELDDIDNEAAGKVSDEVKQKSNNKRKPKTDKKTDDNQEDKNKLEPYEILANRVIAAAKESLQKENDPIKDMINTLYKKALESPIPKKDIVKRSPFEFLKLAMMDYEQYKSTWEKAKAIVLEKHQNNAEAMQKLDKYFGQGVNPPFAISQLDKAIKNGMDTLGMDLNKIIREYLFIGNASKKQLIEYFNERLGLDEAQSKQMADFVGTRFEELTKLKKQKIVEKMFADKGKTLDKKAKAGLIQKTLDMINLGVYDDSALLDIIKERDNLPVLTNEDVQFIIDNMNKAAAVDRTTNDGDYEWRKLMSEIEIKISRRLTPSSDEKFAALTRALTLMLPKTHFRNFLANAIMPIPESVSNIFAIPFDKMTERISGNRTTTLNQLEKEQLSTFYKGFMQGVNETLKDWKYGINTYQAFGQYELKDSEHLYRDQYFQGKMIGNALNKMTQTVGYSLMLGDRPFYAGYYLSKLSEMLKANNVDAPTQEMLDAAKSYADERTFQSMNIVSKWVSKIRKPFNNPNTLFGKGVNAAVYSQIPFTLTLSNMTERLIDYTPGLGMLRAWHRYELFKKNPTMENQQKFAITAGRQLAGLPMGLMFFSLVAAGLVTGGYPSSDKEKELLKQSGWRPYSFKIGNRYFSYEWLQPLSGIIAMSADLYQAVKNPKNAGNAILSGVAKALEALSAQSLARNISDFMGADYSIERKFAKILTSPVNIITNPLRVLTDLTDPYYRETYSPSAIQSFINQQVARVPIISYSLPARLDMFGKEIKKYGGEPNPINVLLNPFLSSIEQDDNVINELRRLYDAVGDTAVVPSKDFKKSGSIPKEMVIKLRIPKDVAEKGYTMTTDEYVEFQKGYGQSVYNALSNQIEVSKYKAAPDTIKSKAVKNIIDNAYEKQKLEFFKKKYIKK